MSDVAIMAKIIGSLPSRYGAFRTAWESAAKESQTMDILTERLIREESRLSADDSSASALSAVSAKVSGTKKGQGPAKRHPRRMWSASCAERKGITRANADGGRSAIMMSRDQVQHRRL